MRRGRRRSRRIDYRRFTLFIILLTVCAVSLAMLGRYAVGSIRRRQQNRQLSQEYAQVFVQSTVLPTEIPEETAAPEPVRTPSPELPQSFRSLTGTPSEEAKKLYRQNKDIVGWLYIPDVVNLPVVYRDNEYYLNHNFNGKEDKGGTLFLDEYHPLTESAQNLVIHGHNMHDGSMFGRIRRYNRLSMVKKNPFARFSTLYAPEDYVIFAVVRLSPDVNSSRYFSYIGRPRFSNTDEFYGYIESLRQRSRFDIPIEVEPTDSLLTLSTCIGDDRLIVVYRKVRDGESTDQLRLLVEKSVEK